MKLPAIVLLLASALVAQTTTTSPTTTALTPKSALKSFIRALDAGERKTVLDLLQADNEQDRKLASATADLAEASAKLREAAIKAYGTDKSRPLGVDPGSSSEAIARIDAATESVTGDSATVKPAHNEGPPIQLVKRSGQWRVPVSELSKDVEAADVEKNLDDMESQVKTMRELTADVTAGKFASATDARQALDQRILRSAMPEHNPATAPATHPSATKP